MHKLKEIRSDTIHIVSVAGDSPGKLKSIDQGGVTAPAATYPGPYSVTPGESVQILETAGTTVGENITVGKIPSNYGRIAWNGSVLMVY